MTVIDGLAPVPPPATTGRPSDAEDPDASAAGEGAFTAAMEEAFGPDEPASSGDATAGTGGDADRASSGEPPLSAQPPDPTGFPSTVVDEVPRSSEADDVDTDPGNSGSSGSSGSSGAEPAPEPITQVHLATVVVATATPVTVTPSDAPEVTTPPTSDGVEAAPRSAPRSEGATIAAVPSPLPAAGGEGPAPRHQDSAGAPPTTPGAPETTDPHPSTAIEPPTSASPTSASPTSASPPYDASPSAGTDRTTAPATGAIQPLVGDAPIATSPSPAAPGPRGIDPPPAWRQVADAVGGRRGDDASPVTIELHPAELGTVRAQITMRGGALHVDLKAATADAKALLEHAIGELRHDLHRLGMRLGHVEVHDAHGRAGGRDPEATAPQGEGTSSGRSDTAPDQRQAWVARTRPAGPGIVETRPTTTATDLDPRRLRPGRPATQVDLNL
jgi:flagellar hook-length control protein FliK